MRPVVEQFGVAAVEAAGLAALGYPAMWIHTLKEAEAIQEFLSKVQQERD